MKKSKKSNAKENFYTLIKANGIAFASIAILALLVVMKAVPTDFTPAGLIAELILTPYLILLFLFAVVNVFMLPFFFIRVKHKKLVDFILVIVCFIPYLVFVIYFGYIILKLVTCCG